MGVAMGERELRQMFAGMSDAQLYKYAMEAFRESADVLAESIKRSDGARVAINHAHRMSGNGRLALEVMAERVKSTVLAAAAAAERVEKPKPDDETGNTDGSGNAD